MKTIAMYLPQFHQIPENDEWWGDGYTEWSAVRRAESLYEGHVQPKEPLDDYFYDLMEKQTMQQQATWMSEYGIDGLCFYHYYFKDGRKLLEKPAENLLKWKEVQMPFCFCWANEAWARTWSNIAAKNAWADKYEKEDMSDKSGILVEQKYGREQAWQQHFEYLLPFFNDERYIKHNGAPIFLIYKPDDICNLYQMSDYWKRLAKKNGFADIYIVGVNVYSPKKGLDAVLFSAPATVIQKGMPISWDKGIRTLNYNAVWESVISSISMSGMKTYHGGFVNYDDTPRRGKNGMAITEFSVEDFKRYLYKLYKKNRDMGNEYLFLNAWNEWGEGMYLEPDKERGFQYLEAIREIKLRMIKDSLNGIEDGTEISQSETSVGDCQDLSMMKKVDKYKMIANCFDCWMALREQNVNIADYLEKYAYDTIAIYGMGILGRHFMYDLAKSKAKVAYIIDKRSALKYPGVEVVNPEENLMPVDAIVVTAVAEFDEIYDVLKGKVNCPIISIGELIKES